MDWKAEAKRAAKLVSKDMFEAHRGAIRLPHPEVCAAFGNDGYCDSDKVQAQVRFLRQSCDEHGIRWLGFGLSEDDFSGVMLFSCPDVEWLNAVVWQAWHDATSVYGDAGECTDTFGAVQMSIASSVIDKHDPVLQLANN